MTSFLVRIYEIEKSYPNQSKISLQIKIQVQRISATNFFVILLAALNSLPLQSTKHLPNHPSFIHDISISTGTKDTCGKQDTRRVVEVTFYKSGFSDSLTKSMR